VHCRKLLDDQNLPTEDHRRLTRLRRGKVARPRFTSGNAKLTEKNEVKKFLCRPLKLISVFLIRFLPGASFGSGELNRAPDRCLALVSCAPSYPSCS
jgi:hypothetical protein